jgi:CHAT domain-containing protein
MARIYASLGDYRAARANLLLGIDLADSVGEHGHAAYLLNELGGIDMASGEPLFGIAAFADALRLAGDPALRVTSDINLARALAEADVGTASAEQLDRLERQVMALEDSPAKARALLAVANLYRQSNLPRTGETAAAALELAVEVDDRHLVASTYTELAEWHFANRRFDEALLFARRATLTAQAIAASESLFRSEWITGKVLRSMGRQADALAAYRSAIGSLAATQTSLVTSERDFRNDVLPLYNEYADVMLASTSSLGGDARREALLEVQEALERLRLAEVQNYFENQCAVPEVFDVRSGQTQAAVVIYPVVFADRTELLVTAGTEVSQFTTNVGLDELTAETRLLRAALEDSASGDDFLRAARRLHEWLIEPATAVIEAASPEVLIFVPAGPLRTIPLAVLHDGQQFLVERYALATTPAVSLISGAASRPARRVLATGIVEPVQGFAALPFVEAELSSVAATFPSAVYSDAEFLVDTLKSEILAGGYSIVHLATHAQFEPDYERSFLLAYDDLVTLDELEDVMSSQRFSTRPVDLLVLSACQTAAGDERAALGLAGVAVKAGARSALASLWQINDESTAELIGEFYRQLATAGSHKAAALRGAQLRLMNDQRYRHPAYWSPFLLIGDWR